MAKIILNNEEFDFTGYNRNTYFNGEDIVSTGYIGGLNGINIMPKLETLMQDDVTSLSIKNNEDNIIYSLNDINMKINNIDESYNGMDAVITNLNVQFN